MYSRSEKHCTVQKVKTYDIAEFRAQKIERKGNVA